MNHVRKESSGMPQPADQATHRRDQRLARTRRVSLWVAGGAAAASLGMGTAFAHDLPGHHVPAAGAPPGAETAARPQTTRPSTSPGAPRHLSQPRQAPANAPAPAQTTSGGS
jgi:hypothetical protein